MTVARKLVHGGLAVTSGQLAQQILLFFRNVIIARFLLPGQFGVALSLATVLTALDATTELGIDLYIIGARTEKDEELQHTLQLIMIGRGCLTGIILFLGAPLIAIFFNVPEMTWAYRFLAVVPFLRGFVHLDLRRFERDLRFLPNAIAMAIAVAAGTVAAIVSAWFFHSVAAILWAYIVQTSVLVFASHAYGEREYRAWPHSQHARALASFGMPLILNGTLMFLLLQGDRALIGSALGVAELARYGVVSVLAAGISSPLQRILGSVFLPVLARQTRGDAAYWSNYSICGGLVTMVASALVIGFSIPGPGIIRVLFGVRYDVPNLLVTLIGIQTAFKLLRAWPQTLPISAGETRSLPQANFIAATGLAVAALLLWNGRGNLLTVALCIMLSEIAAALYSFVTIARAGPFFGQSLASFMGLLCLSVAACTLSTAAPLPLAIWQSMLLATGIWIACCLAILKISPPLWALARSLLCRISSARH